jgi:hypothetical protein
MYVTHHSYVVGRLEVRQVVVVEADAAALEVLDFVRDVLDLKGEYSVRALCALLGGHQGDRRPRHCLQQVVAARIVADILQTESIAVEAGRPG